VQILIPMAGSGKRFREAGYELPKPLIDAGGIPMIERVLGNLPASGKVVLIVLSEQVGLIPPSVAGCVRVVTVGALTEGAACTVLLAEDHIESGEALLIANADQWLDWAPDHFADYCTRSGADGCIATFRASGPKWSYAEVREDGTVAAVVEKVPISSDGTCGVYWWRRASDCFAAVRRMLGKNLRVNGEFYLAPAFNEMILDGARIVAYPVPRMWGLGTPADLKLALEAKPWRR